jgi:cell division protein FtsB
MNILQIIKKRWKLIIVVFAVILSALYLIFGEHGLLYLKQRKIDLEEYTQRVEKQEQKKLILEQEVQRMRTDKGYLEEIIREETGMIKKNEVRIVISEEDDGEKEIGGSRQK